MSGLLFNPRSYDPAYLDAETVADLQAVIDFFETKGLEQMKREHHASTWYEDFLSFIAERGLFARFATPARVGELTGVAAARWDTVRINELNEILAFYSLSHWYAWQVTVLGLGPVWTSANDAAAELTGELLADGAVFGFGLSEQHHGADIYATDMVLQRSESGGWSATGAKYYIGNGNVAGRLAVFGRFADDDPQYPGEYVFFLVDPHHPAYQLQKNVVASQMFVAAFALENYPVDSQDILHTGKPAWDAALATVNVGKANLGWASIGICEHAFYEAVGHAHKRVLYGTRVTEFSHVRRMLADAYARLLAMKLYAARATDYMRTASDDDRRFLLFNPLTKMKVTGEGERVIDLLWDVIAARGFEQDTYFEQATSHIRALPKLEGTVAVNVALVLKFLPAYLQAAASDAELTVPPVVLDAADDTYLFNQGAAAGLSKIAFHDPKPAFARFAQLPNVALFIEQMNAFAQLVVSAPVTEAQRADLDYLQSLGQLFTQVVYAQLVCEAAAQAMDGAADGQRGGVVNLAGLQESHLDRIFAVFVQDVAGYALELHGRASATAAQREAALALIKAPVVDPAAADEFVAEVVAYADAYQMNP